MSRMTADIFLTMTLVTECVVNSTLMQFTVVKQLVQDNDHYAYVNIKRHFCKTLRDKLCSDVLLVKWRGMFSYYSQQRGGLLHVGLWFIKESKSSNQ